MSASDVIIEITRRKLSRDVLYSPDSRVVASVESKSTSNKVLHRTKSRPVFNGASFSVPLVEDVESLKLMISSVDGAVTTYIGSCVLSRGDYCADADPNEEPTEKNYRILNDNDKAVGKCRLLVYVQSRFNSEKSKHKKKGKHRRTGAPVMDEISRTTIPPGFRFRKPDRIINWDRIRNLNLERVQEHNDSALLMSCIDDIALGNLDDEDVDPRLHQAIQLQQYTAQYLLGCQDLLRQRKSVISDAYQCLKNEEAELDLQIAKLRSRNSALAREEDDLRDLKGQYTDLIKEFNPPILKVSETKKHRPKEREDTLQYEQSLNPSSTLSFKSTSPPVKQQNNNDKHAMSDENEESHHLNVFHRWPKKKFDDNNRNVYEDQRFVSGAPPKGNNASVEWSSAKVVNLADSSEVRCDRMEGTQMSVDSLMGSTNFSGGIASKSMSIRLDEKKRQEESKTVDMHSSAIKLDTKVEVAQMDDEHLTNQTAHEPEPDPDIYSRDKKTIGQEKIPTPESVNSAEATKSLPSNTDQVFENDTSPEKEKIPKANASEDCEGSELASHSSFHSAQRSDVYSDDLNEHNELLEHDSLDANPSLNKNAEDASQDRYLTNTNDFSFVSDNANNLSTNIDINYQNDSKLNTKQDNSTPLKASSPVVENDMALLDASDMSFHFAESSEKIKAEDTKPSSTQRVEGDEDDDVEDFSRMSDLDSKKRISNHEGKKCIDDELLRSRSESYSSVESSHVSAGLQSTGGSEAKFETQNKNEMASITINVHRGPEEDDDDVLLGTNRFSVTYTSEGSGSSYNDIKGTDTPNNDLDNDESSQLGTSRLEDKVPLSTINEASHNFDDEGELEENDSIHSGASSENPIKWHPGRAPLELIETSNALDVFISAIRFDSSNFTHVSELYVQLEFLDSLSQLSSPISTNVRSSILPVSFASYLSFTRETSLILADEISHQKDDLAISVRLIEAKESETMSDVNVFADAVIDLWVMIEDNCSIVRQEIDLYDTHENSCIGSIVVDVRGHHLLSRCS